MPAGEFNPNAFPFTTTNPCGETAIGGWSGYATSGTTYDPDYSSPFTTTTGSLPYQGWTGTYGDPSGTFTDPSIKRFGDWQPQNPWEREFGYPEPAVVPFEPYIPIPPKDDGITKLLEEIERQRRANEEAQEMAATIELETLRTKLKKAEDEIKKLEAAREADRVRLDETKPKDRRIDLDL